MCQHYTGLHGTSDTGTAPAPVILSRPAARGLYESQGPGLSVAVVKVQPALVEELSLQSYRLAQLTVGQGALTSRVQHSHWSRSSRSSALIG